MLLGFFLFLFFPPRTRLKKNSETIHTPRSFPHFASQLFTQTSLWIVVRHLCCDVRKITVWIGTCFHPRPARSEKRKSSRRRPLKRTPWRHTFFRTTIRSKRRRNSPALLGRWTYHLGEQRCCPHRVLGGEGASSGAPAGTGSPPKGSCREHDGGLALHQPNWDLGLQRPLRRRWRLW